MKVWSFTIFHEKFYGTSIWIMNVQLVSWYLTSQLHIFSIQNENLSLISQYISVMIILHLLNGVYGYVLHSQSWKFYFCQFSVQN